MCEDRIESLASMMTIVGSHLGIQHRLTVPNCKGKLCISSFGSVDDRTQSVADLLNDANNYIVSNDPRVTRELRLFVVKHIPDFLMAYQSLRFPSHMQDETLPMKSSLEKFPEVVQTSGFFLPVSTCLRLLAVALIDEEARESLIETETGVKAIVSHMVDDPLNPYQRESAVFVVKVLTENFPRGQEAISKVMRY